MTSRQSVRGRRSYAWRPAVFLVVAVLGACDPRSPDPTASSSSFPSAAAPSVASPAASASTSGSGSLVIVGRIVTLDEPPSRRRC